MHIALNRKKRSFHLTCMISAFIIVLIIILWFFAFIGKAYTTVSSFDSYPVLVIDPGHGGYDRGATGIDGTPEKDLNLSISYKLKFISELMGVDVIMTRSDDTPRTAKEEYSEHDDLVYRTEIANNTPNAMMISIHQNTFPSELVSGVQILYSDSNESRRIAQPAPKKLYITSNTNCPTLLVECGFISNGKDLAKLKTNDYQICFSAVLAASVLQYLCSTSL